jgi:hypothetical protein
VSERSWCHGDTQAAGCAPSGEGKALLSSRGGGVRVGPFAAWGGLGGLDAGSNAGLAAAAEWLHCGAAAVVLNCGGAESLSGVPSGVPSAAQVGGLGLMHGEPPLGGGPPSENSACGECLTLAL